MPGGAGLDDALARVDRIAAVVRDGAAESEQLGCLAPAVVDALHDSRLFLALTPTELGGLGLTIPESVRVFLRVAELDASTAWTLTILSDGALFTRRLPDDVFRTICSDPAGLAAGTLNPATAQATRADGGFTFSGRATYLSGSAHAMWIMASAIVFEDGAPVVTDGGIDIRTGLMPVTAARSLDTWNVTGMRATGSSDYEFDDVFIEDDWTFEPFRPRPSDDVFGAIPLWAQLGGGLAASAVGAARNAIDRFVELAATKVPVGNFSRLAERAPAQMAVGEAEGLQHAAEAVLLDTVDEVWTQGVERRPFEDIDLARQRLGTVTAVRLAAQAVDLIHDAAGMNAVTRDSVLERTWRDVHTITQHVILSTPRFEIAGRVLMGLDPASPVI